MKKLSMLSVTFLIWILSFGQSYQLNVTFTADEWGYVSYSYNPSDSTGDRFVRKLRNTVQANLPITAWTQNITVDTVPNVAINWIYATWKSMPNGLAIVYGNTVITTINAMTNQQIVDHRNAVNSNYTNLRNDVIRPLAKRKNIDN